jgi:hypothetical protein
MHEAPIDRGCPSDDAVGWAGFARHAELGLPVSGEEAELFQACRIDERVDALAGSELTLLPMLRKSFGAAAELDRIPLGHEFFDKLIHGRG